MPDYIRRARTIHGKNYRRDFVRVTNEHRDFCFECDKTGHPLFPLEGLPWENYLKCVMGVYSVHDEGIVVSEYSYRERAILKCTCGNEVVLSSFTNTCMVCRADYNMSGELLAPRCYWGEETGEHWTDCI